jgi:hypothetical protein
MEERGREHMAEKQEVASTTIASPIYFEVKREARTVR